MDKVLKVMQDLQYTSFVNMNQAFFVQPNFGEMSVALKLPFPITT